MQKLHAAVVKAFQDPEIQDTWAKLGAEPGGATPEEFRDLVAKDAERYSHSIVAGGLEEMS